MADDTTHVRLGISETIDLLGFSCTNTSWVCREWSKTEKISSVQQLTNIPKHIRDKYKIVWEIPMKHMINMSRDRGAYICQSQSLNLWVENPSYKILNSMHFYSWQQGLKTGIYYLRRKAAHQAQQFTIEPDKKNNVNSSTQEAEEEICDMCSS